jgi:rubredoxin-NAD+ reductase
MKPIIIIGAGLAGYTAAREFRKLDKTTSLIVITADDGGFYSKPMLSNAFAQGKSADGLVTQNAARMAEQLSAVIVTGTRVTAIDPASRTVETSSGKYEYSKLVIAIGAQPIRLGLQGNAAQEVLSVNHVSDYAEFRTRLAAFGERPVRVTILGAGLIGCEFADDLAGAGHLVTLVDPNPLPLSSLAAPALSQGLHAALKAKGVTMALGTTAAGIDRLDEGVQVRLADGESVAADVVLSAVGLRPDLHLAQAAGLATGRGIVIDSTGQTSAPDIFALGDCAEYTFAAEGTTRMLPYIAPLMNAARAIARTLTGQPTAIDLKASPVIVKTPCYPLALVPPPMHAVADGVWEAEDSGAHTICRFYDAQNILIGFGVAPQEASVRNQLMAALGTAKVTGLAA